MKDKKFILRLLMISTILCFIISSQTSASEDLISRGAYLVDVAGCINCHTNEDGEENVLPVGGRPFRTKFGILYSSNITPHPITGIGRWNEADFVRALHDGVNPEGKHYYPVFPFTSYTQMSREDAVAIKAYLFSLPPVDKQNKAHELNFPFGWRILQSVWKLIFFESRRFEPATERSKNWNRGAYLVTALAHCGECHTPRNALGALEYERAYAGHYNVAEKQLASNITSDSETGIGLWSVADIVRLLKTGLKPNFDNVQGAMEEVIENGLKNLVDEDLHAIALYIKSISPVHNAMEDE